MAFNTSLDFASDDARSVAGTSEAGSRHGTTATRSPPPTEFAATEAGMDDSDREMDIDIGGTLGVGGGTENVQTNFEDMM